MRFLYKRPRIDTIREELDTVIDVMISDYFIYIDLFWYSLILSLFLSPIIHSILLSIIAFLSCYAFFTCLYIFVFKGSSIKN